MCPAGYKGSNCQTGELSAIQRKILDCDTCVCAGTAFFLSNSLASRGLGGGGGWQGEGKCPRPITLKLYNLLQRNLVD